MDFKYILKIFLKLIFPFLITGCSVSNGKYFFEMNHSLDTSYGYTAENPIPIKNGGLKSTLKTTEYFVSHIRTANGNKFEIMGRKYKMLNPKCNPNLIMYGGFPIEIINIESECIINYYHLISQFESDTITLYFDFGSKGSLKLPVDLGFELEE